MKRLSWPLFYFFKRKLELNFSLVKRPDKEGTIDFGDGTCDNLAVFTDDEGNETEIKLKRRK